MAGVSKIEWCEQTWNPFAGCAVVSPGCTNCYAMKMAARLDAMGQPLYKGLTKPSKAGPVWRGTVRANPDALLAPLKRKKPTTYFVNSMSDLFYEKFSDELIDQVFAVMALSPQHTFQVLTKRAERMREYLSDAGMHRRVDIAMVNVLADAPIARLPTPITDENYKWPLPNCWLGVSAERQQEWDERVPYLRDTPAAIRFVSYEPALGPLDITLARMWSDKPWLHWLICGGESGPHARPMNPQWARDVRDQCHAGGIAFFHKQNGEFASVSEVEGAGAHFHFPDGRTVRRVGKKTAGRLLDGVLHNEFPIRARSAGSLPLSIAGNEPGGRAGAVSSFARERNGQG